MIKYLVLFKYKSASGQTRSEWTIERLDKWSCSTTAISSPYRRETRYGYGITPVNEALNETCIGLYTDLPGSAAVPYQDIWFSSEPFCTISKRTLVMKYLGNTINFVLCIVKSDTRLQRIGKLFQYLIKLSFIVIKRHLLGKSKTV